MLKFLKQRKILSEVISLTLFNFFAVSTVTPYVINLASMFIALFLSVGKGPMLTCCISMNLKLLRFLTSLNYIQILLNICFQGTKKQIFQDRYIRKRSICWGGPLSLTSIVVKVSMLWNDPELLYVWDLNCCPQWSFLGNCYCSAQTKLNSFCCFAVIFVASLLNFSLVFCLSLQAHGKNWLTVLYFMKSKQKLFHQLLILGLKCFSNHFLQAGN